MLQMDIMNEHHLSNYILMFNFVVFVLITIANYVVIALEADS